MQYTKSKWSASDLMDKKVEFRIPLTNGTVGGIGTFIISEGKEGLDIQIGVDAPGRKPDERRHVLYRLPQRLVDRIERHSDQSVAEFRVS
jgi:hypothetical protein